MSRRKSAIGIAVLLTLALSALAASGASAAEKGTTAFTCAPVTGQANTVGFSDEHCLNAATNFSVTREHKTITSKTTITATNEKTASETTARRPSILTGKPGGVKAQVTCAEVHGEGFLENKETAGGEMYLHATGTGVETENKGKLHYTGCKVTEPAGKGCVIPNETITTNELTGTTEGTGDEIKIVPVKAGGNFAEIKIEGCSVGGLNNTFPVLGSIKATPSGATLTSTEEGVTGQGTLKFGGQVAGLDGALTFRGHVKNEEPTNPITVTTPDPETGKYKEG
jgi:hypothetical protein